MARALPKLAGGVGRALTGVGSASKKVLFDDTPIFNAAFDLATKGPLMAASGLYGAIPEFDKKKKGPKGEGTPGIETPDAAGGISQGDLIVPKLDEQILIMKHHLDISKKILKETEKDRFASIEERREAKRRIYKVWIVKPKLGLGKEDDKADLKPGLLEGLSFSDIFTAATFAKIARDLFRGIWGRVVAQIGIALAAASLGFNKLINKK